MAIDFRAEAKRLLTNQESRAFFILPEQKGDMQITKYKWDNWEPHLVLKSGNETRKIRLFGNHSFVLGQKTCTGFFSGGKSYECPGKRKLDYGQQCNECKIRDLFALCMQCTGEKCINEKRRAECEKENYFIYLAAFDSLLKVGISYEYRFLERLVEQGADFGAKIGRVKDGLAVRDIEQKIMQNLDIVDRVRGAEKHKMLFCNPNTAAANISRAIAALRKDFSQYLIRPEIYDMRSYYRLHNVFLNPSAMAIKDNTELSGEIVAAKGNIFVLRKGGEFFSINAHEIIGREILGNGLSI
ncbi:MAG: DUF2797 domain-containing protein [Candidatus Aenigmarchaeota archaeon]|nr:DUF2797 domain-containing protein [Candidatus Aenigmarchaeota archaeon]